MYQYLRSLVSSGDEKQPVSGSEAEFEQIRGNQAALEAAREVMERMQPRVVEADGGYKYRQHCNGVVEILEGHGRGLKLQKGDRGWDAITAQIGRHPAQNSRAGEPQLDPVGDDVFLEQPAESSWFNPMTWESAEVAGQFVLGQADSWSEWGARWLEGGDVTAMNAKNEVSLGRTEVRASDVLDAGEKYIQQVERYGFGDDSLLKEDGGARRGEMDELWCSGLVTATLLDLGYDVDAPIDGQHFREHGRDKELTIRQIVEGMSEPLAESDAHAKAIADVPRGSDSFSDYLGRRGDAAYGFDGLFGSTPAGDSLRVKGAAGAVVLAGIGREVASTHDARPGDFVQSREVGGKDGHASIVHSVHAQGTAVFGLPGSPELVEGSDDGSPFEGGTMHEGTFIITRETDPKTVFDAFAFEWRVLESQVAKAISPASQKALPNGGVWVSEYGPVPDLKRMAADEKRWYIGRLSSSPWADKLSEDS